MRITFTHLVLTSFGFLRIFLLYKQTSPLYKPSRLRATCAKQTIIPDFSSAYHWYKNLFFFSLTCIFFIFLLRAPFVRRGKYLLVLEYQEIATERKRNDSRYFANYSGFSGGTKNLRISFGRAKTSPILGFSLYNLTEGERRKKPKIAAIRVSFSLR